MITGDQPVGLTSWAAEPFPDPTRQAIVWVPYRRQATRPGLRYIPHMPQDIALRCKCGRVRGIVDSVAPDRVCRARCYCPDCRAFLHFLERHDQLDAWGGTDVVQVEPCTVRITEGFDSLRCMKLAPAGMYRWYSGCCGTPFGNMISAGVPFIGIGRGAFDVPEQGDTALFGESVGGQARFAVHGTPPNAHRIVSVRVAVRAVRCIVRWKLRSLGGKRPGPYFDDARRPVREPRVLGTEEREALRARDAEPLPPA